MNVTKLPKSCATFFNPPKKRPHLITLTLFVVLTALLLFLGGVNSQTAVNAGSNIYHISPSGNDSNPGTEAEPWQTIGQANQTLQAGDTVLIHAGTYNEQIRPVNSGTSHNSRITYKPFGDGDVILTFFSNVGGQTDGALGLGGRNYITVSGLADGDSIGTRRIILHATGFVNAYGNVCGSEGVIVEHIEMIHSGSNAPGRGFAFCLNFWDGNFETRYNILRYNRIVGVSSASKDPVNFTEDLVTLAHTSHHNLIEHNELETVKHSVIYADSPNSYSNVIRNNIIKNPEHTALSIWSAGVDLPDGARFLVENNWLEASGATTEPDGGPGNALQWGSDELIIRYNVMVQGGSQDSDKTSAGGLSGGTSTSFGAPYFATDGRIYNNTIVKNRGVAVGMFDFGVDPVDLGRHRFVNNIFYDSDTTATGNLLAVYWDLGRPTSDRYINNVWGRPGGNANEAIISSSIGNANLATAVASWRNPDNPELTAWNGYENVYDPAPGFADYANDIYTLAAHSPYLDAGAPLTTVATADSGTGTTLLVDDSRFFYAEASEFPAWMGVQNEWIAIGATLETSVVVQITAVDDTLNQIILAEAVNRNSGDFIWLWRDSEGTIKIAGLAPAIGAFDLSDFIYLPAILKQE